MEVNEQDVCSYLILGGLIRNGIGRNKINMEDFMD